MQRYSSEELQAIVAELRQRTLATAKRTDEAMAAQRARARELEPLERFVNGHEVETPHGKHFETETLYSRNRRHGSMEIARLQALPADLLDGIAQGELPPSPPERWAFIDTETTGLNGGSGTCAFLIGVGRITPAGFHVRQFFLRDFNEEPSVLQQLKAALADAEVLVTYNGKTFDVPLLETRYRLSRIRPPFASMGHLDLLYGARRLWRLRFESCRLVELENRILGHSREDDVPGELIPEIYYDYIRSGRAARLAPVFVHNVLDIVSLACLTGIVPWAFRESGGELLHHAAEFVGLGRWLVQAGQPEKARDLWRSAVNRNLRDDLLYRTLWDLAQLEKKLENRHAAVELYTELAGIANPHRADALEALAKHYEHCEKNFVMALEFAQAAWELAPTPELDKRRARLMKRKGQTMLLSV